MSNLDSTAQIDLSCPECGRQFQKSIRELQGGAKFPCPNNDCNVVFNPADFAGTLKEVDDALEKFGRDIGDMFK